MKRMSLTVATFALLLLGVLGGNHWLAHAEDKKLDVTKGRVVEKPTKSLVLRTREFKVGQPKAKKAAPKVKEAAPKAKEEDADRSKLVRVEAPTKDIIVLTEPDADTWSIGPVNEAVTSVPAAKRSSPHTTVAENPKVEPGLVRWHGSMLEAQTASKQSGKPVLVFHMMGNLDDRFC